MIKALILTLLCATTTATLAETMANVDAPTEVAASLSDHSLKTFVCRYLEGSDMHLAHTKFLMAQSPQDALKLASLVTKITMSTYKDERGITRLNFAGQVRTEGKKPRRNISDIQCSLAQSSACDSQVSVNFENFSGVLCF